MAFAVIVTATAKAGQETGQETGLPASRIAQSSPGARWSVDIDPGATGSIPLKQLASLTLGRSEELSAQADEIEPRLLVKAPGAFPNVDRSAKGDPFIALRPSLDARRKAPLGEGAYPAPAGAAADGARSTGVAAELGRSDAARQVGGDGLHFEDGATPAIPLARALASASPAPSDGLVKLVLRRPGAAQATVVAKSEGAEKSHYADLIDPHDSLRQMRCLAEAIYFESRSEPEHGQAAVAQVVLNRVRSGQYPSNICGVVYQDRNHPFACQFSFACEGKSLRIEEPGPWAVATRIAKEVVEGVNYNPRVGEALNYHANYVRPYWANSLRRTDTIGNHIFYRPI